jgi:hypothetical protein
MNIPRHSPPVSVLAQCGRSDGTISLPYLQKRQLPPVNRTFQYKPVLAEELFFCIFL